MKPEFPEPENFSRDEYMRILAAKEVAEALLQEARELIALRDEQIVILREKAATSARLQSQIDNMQYEIDYLQDMIEKEGQKHNNATSREQQLIAELKQGMGQLQNLDTLEAQLLSTQKQLKIYVQEADELAALNAELLLELKKVPMLQSSLDMEKQQNRILLDKIEKLEKSMNSRRGFMDV
jgi:chromosome segregation ATPase